MSVRAESNASALNTVPQDMGAAIAEATPENNHLAEGAAYATATPENPLTRNLAVSIRASLNGAPAPDFLMRPTTLLVLSRLAPAFPELCLQKNKGVWQPSPEALKAIFQQAPPPPAGR